MTLEGFDPTRVQRAAKVAHDYDALLGLAWVAAGCGFLAAALAHQVLFIFAGALVSVGCRWWYRRRFGAVRPGEGQVARGALVGSIGLVTMVPVMLVDAQASPPLSLTLLGFAAWMCTFQVLTLRRVGLSAVHWAVYCAVVVAALVPLAGVGGGAPVSVYVFTVVGLALVVLGLVDHVRLVRAMPPVPTEPEVDEAVRR